MKAKATRTMNPGEIIKKGDTTDHKLIGMKVVILIQKDSEINLYQLTVPCECCK